MERVLVIGAGGSARREVTLLRETLPHSEIAAWNTGKTREEVVGADKVFFTEEEALAFSPQMVFVATPTSKHVQYAEKFMDIAEVMLIDKPLDSDLNRCEVFCRNARVSKTKVFVNFQRRYMKCWKTLRNMLLSEDFGEFLYGKVSVNSYYPAWRPQKDNLYVAKKELGGGVLLTECHEIDLIQWCLTSIQGVSARTVTQKDYEVENQAIVIFDLDFSYGRRPFNLIVNDIDKHTKREMELFFEKETLVINEDLGTITLKEKNLTIKCVDTNSPHKELLLDVLNSEIGSAPELKDGIRVNAIVDAAKKSMISKKTEKVVCSVCPEEGVNYLEEAIKKIQDAFGSNLVAVYGLGSLGYGGYVNGWSDFDIDVLVDTGHDEEQEVYAKGKEIENEIKELGFERIDIRVYNYEHLNERKTILTYGQCSRATMLCDSGVLLAGREVRDKIIRPSRSEQNEEAMKLLSHMLDNGDEWWNSRPWDDIAAHFALMGRFLYTADTGLIAGKQVALEYLLNKKKELYSKEELQWVMWALACRNSLNRALIQESLHQNAIEILRNMFKRTLMIIEGSVLNDKTK